MATIHDVALKAGVSVTTVSRVLNNRGYISQKTRDKVYQTMNELNYRPNEIARSLLRKQSNVIGLIIPDVSHPFFGELANYIEYHAYRNGLKMMLCNSHMDPSKEREYVEMLKGNRVDGIIMGSHTLEVDEYMNLHSPIVTLDRQIGADIPFISSDNYQGGVMAAELLLAKGRRHVAHICGNLELQMLSNRRTTGFTDTLEAHGIKPVIIHETDLNVFSQHQYTELVGKLLAQHPEVDGLFVTSDLMAIHALKQIVLHGRKVPEDIAIVGYDDIQAAGYAMPGITTIRQPMEAMAELAVELIRSQIAEEEIGMEHILPVTLVERETT
ncbi:MULTISPECIES: LacI family DNA-binding transcriptional regulator [Paenibacillus]|uniref:LacI family DNA-binding transcriptional regulator n=1 Tax=Paenibacillus TaxID=44249 RepID=UPI0009A7EA44|nr:MULTISPECIES: LacI family DNA-binding transcriptional regulator [Paenibacillus]WDQ32970.1 LacI family DNA-binding transcriptional regulator [Paenibacillus marchantiae]SLK18414.1 transcriptional regulator, LacI family [Paenibacillus sp. RU5A]SOC75231.1 transcriptional regulator, LacI family [Paenibacillus sp. RU26A]SOC77293.1 transcriptional regulator, LacI family [Paenibacillus sp. RU5M]